METGHEHFSHPHNLSFHKSLEATRLTCTGCNFPCTAGTPVYACRRCKFFLHEQCFKAPRTLTHRSHRSHPLSLFPSPTYTSGSFICSSCNQTGSGLCFCCTTCEYDLHIHCAYKTPEPQQAYQQGTTTPPNQIEHKAHLSHPLMYVPKPPYTEGTCTCDVCGTNCDSNDALYHCEACGYDVHLGCVSLPETAHREDHKHSVSLLLVNPFKAFECDICWSPIAQNHCMYYCTDGCDYGMHVKCVDAKVLEKTPVNAMTAELEMFKLQNQMRVHQMAMDTMAMARSGFYHNRYYRY